jgi:hypothetical protein
MTKTIFDFFLGAGSVAGASFSAAMGFLSSGKKKGRKISVFSLGLVVKQALCRKDFVAHDSICKLPVIQCVSGEY